MREVVTDKQGAGPESQQAADGDHYRLPQSLPPMTLNTILHGVMDAASIAFAFNSLT